MSKDRALETEATEDVLVNLYENYFGKIVRYIFVRISDQNEAENLGGDVFLRALQSLKSYRGGKEQMRAWLFKIAHNIVVDYLRKKSKRSNISINDVDIPDRLNIEEVVETKLELKRLSNAVKHLTPAQREVIGLRFFGELSSAEVGEILGKSSGAVREMQHVALETLRKLM